MKGLWRLFLDFWSRPVAPEPMAAFRITIALILLIDLCLTLAPNAEAWFGPLGVFEPGDVRMWQDQDSLNKDAVLPGIPRSLEQLPRTRWSLLGPDAEMSHVWLHLGALGLCGGFLLAGLFSRLAALGAWALLLSLHMRNPNIPNAGDVLLRIALFYLALMPAGAVWSVGGIVRRRLGWTARQAVAPWAMRLAQIQIVVLYFFSGIEKHAPIGPWLAALFAGDKLPRVGDWNDGSAVAWALRDVLITRVDWFIWIPWEIFVPFTYLTLTWEIMFPLLVLFGITRRWALAIGYAVHMGIFLTMEVNHFSFTTLAFYLLLIPAAVLMDIVGRRAGEAADSQTTGGRTRFYRVFYDSLCPVCRKSVLWLRRLDWLGVLKFEDLHDRARAEAALPAVTYADQLRRMYVLRPDGQYFGGFAAVRAMAAVLPLLWPVMPLLWLPGTGFVGKRVYDFIARNRFRYARCDDEMCSLHLKLLAGRQIDDEVIAQVVEFAERRKKAETPAVP